MSNKGGSDISSTMVLMDGRAPQGPKIGRRFEQTSGPHLRRAIAVTILGGGVPEAMQQTTRDALACRGVTRPQA